MKEVAREYDRTHFSNGATTTKERLQVLQAVHQVAVQKVIQIFH